MWVLHHLDTLMINYTTSACFYIKASLLFFLFKMLKWIQDLSWNWTFFNSMVYFVLMELLIRFWTDYSLVLWSRTISPEVRGWCLPLPRCRRSAACASTHPVPPRAWTGDDQHCLAETSSPRETSEEHRDVLSQRAVNRNTIHTCVRYRRTFLAVLSLLSIPLSTFICSFFSISSVVPEITWLLLCLNSHLTFQHTQIYP